MLATCGVHENGWNMVQRKSEWQSDGLTATYLEGIRGGIPGGDLQFALIRKIIECWFPEPVHVLDLGCGDGILGRFLLDSFDGAHADFVDFSGPMLAMTTKNLRNPSRARVLNADFSDRDWMKCFGTETRFDVVVSGFAIHHQPDERKKEIYAEIFELLTAGGVFLNLEHVSSATEEGEKMHRSIFVDYLLRFHEAKGVPKTREEIESVYYDRSDKQENILAPVDLQCQWLRAIGYEDVDCFFKIFELALIGGRKAV